MTLERNCLAPMYKLVIKRGRQDGCIPTVRNSLPAVHQFISVLVYYIPLVFVHRTVDRKQLGNTVCRRKVIHNKERKKHSNESTNHMRHFLKFIACPQGIRIIQSNTSFLLLKIHLYTGLHVSAPRSHHQASTVEQIQIYYLNTVEG